MDVTQEQDLANLRPGQYVQVTVKMPSISTPTWTYSGAFARVDFSARILVLTVTYETQVYRRLVNDQSESQVVTEEQTYRLDDIVSAQYDRPAGPPPTPPPPVDLPVFQGSTDDIYQYAPDPSGLPDGLHAHTQFANIYWAVVAQTQLYLRDPCPPGFIFDIDSSTVTLPENGRTEAPWIFEGPCLPGLYAP
ncbi:hypothetical protein ACIRRA_35345 [Nocardia sp. NPDC101769]|uniref:hypothetical protein n=1 Tax=Nocardia sp. NPDC101769 TaxID=3364333 RepID=UPI0037FAC8A1